VVLQDTGFAFETKTDVWSPFPKANEKKLFRPGFIHYLIHERFQYVKQEIFPWFCTIEISG
jgi:hypothetical protein